MAAGVGTQTATTRSGTVTQRAPKAKAEADAKARAELMAAREKAAREQEAREREVGPGRCCAGGPLDHPSAFIATPKRRASSFCLTKTSVLELSKIGFMTLSDATWVQLGGT